MIVYLDVLILENFIVDFFILFITAQTLRQELSIKTGIFTSALASIYIVTLVVPSLKIFTLVPFKIAIPFIIILITFRIKSITFNIKSSITYILYSMLIAGMCYFIEYSCPSADNCWSSIRFTYKKLLISVMIIYILINRLIVYINERKEITQLIYLVDIFISKKQRSVRAFLDTGNELKEPGSNLPVLIVDNSVFEGIDLKGYDTFYIPYKVIDGAYGRLKGFMPDYITINVGGKLIKRKVIVACSEGKLSNFKDYQALLSRGII